MKFLIIFISLFLYALPMKRGDFVLIYDNSQINWANKFKIAEIGGIDDDKIISKVKKLHNIKLGYDWLAAFYFYTSGKNNKFVQDFYIHRKSYTLNPDGPFLHCKKNGYNWCREYYYNFGNEKVIDKKIDYLIKNLKKHKLNGIFFDWASGEYILQKEYKKIYQNFKKLNPNKNFFEMIGLFYKKLKQKNIFFITNQAFRHHKYLLPYIKYDMTESYITTTKYIKKRIMIQNKGVVEKVAITDYYPIGSLEKTLFYINLLTKYKKIYQKFGFKNFIYLNYLAPKYEKIYPNQSLYKEVSPKNGIFFSFAMAKLTDNIVYAQVTESKKLEENPIYFYDLGKVKGKNYKKLQKGIYIRFYQNGFVLVSNNFDKKEIKLNINKPFYDIYNDKWIKNNLIKLNYEIDTITNKKLPVGRVFIYKGKK